MTKKNKKSYIVPESAVMQILDSVFLMGEVSDLGNGGNDVSEDPILSAPRRRPF